MPQAQPLADNPLFEHPLFKPWRSERGRRIVGLVLALLIEAILLIILLTLNIHDEPAAAPGGVTVVELTAQSEQPEETEQAEQEPSESAQPTEQRADLPDPQVDRPDTVQPEAPTPEQVPHSIIATPFELPASRESARRPQRDAPKQAYGPADTGSRSGMKDSEVVGTAPNGQPLYAARWHREPTDAELAGYLSTATGPGWGLIACRTAPKFRVIDCVPLAEYPQGAMINRAVLAAAWQFRVRPPMLGGKAQIGSWVRIRIDYTNR